MKQSKKPAFKPALAYEAGHLAYCRATIAEQQRLLGRIKSALPPEIAQHALHCVVSGKRLLIYTDLASWASQIRFFQQVILNKLRESGQRNISALHIKVIPQTVERQASRRPALPSAQTIDAVFSQFNATSNDELALALLRLGERLAQKAHDETL